MAIALLLLLSCQAWAQSVISLGSPQASVRPGQTLTVQISFNASTAAAIQWTMPFPVGWTASTSAGQRAVAATKAATCNPANGVCIIYGLNANLIQAGEVAVYTVSIPSVATPGNYNLVLSSPLAVTATGTAIQVSAGQQFTVTVLSRFDLTNDGKVDMQDLNIAVGQAVGTTACTTADFNGDGKCDLLDVFALILAALSGG